MGSELGVPDDKILALEEYATSELYDEQERAALQYADSITLSEQRTSTKHSSSACEAVSVKMP